jgi:hypothetical protein
MVQLWWMTCGGSKLASKFYGCSNSSSKFLGV